MARKKQRLAAKREARKTIKTWTLITPKQKELAKTERKKRAKPGSTGEGNYYRIEIRDKNQFSIFRNHDVGERGGLQRIAGKRPNGNWDTQAWLIEKHLANVVGSTLKSRYKDVQKLIDTLGSKPKHVKGDIFKAKPEKNVPEKDKPTPAMKKAWAGNIKKAQEARKKK